MKRSGCKETGAGCREQGRSRKQGAEHRELRARFWEQGVREQGVREELPVSGHSLTVHGEHVSLLDDRQHPQWFLVTEMIMMRWRP